MSEAEEASFYSKLPVRKHQQTSAFRTSASWLTILKNMEDSEVVLHCFV